MKNQRLQGFDIAKGLAFLAVVWGHFISPYGTIFVYSFHLPVFCFISGFFLSKRKSIGEYAVDKLKQLMGPYVVTCLIYMALTMIKETLITKSLSGGFWAAVQIFKNAVYAVGLVPGNTLMDVEFIGPIWFLPALFFALLIARVAIELPAGWIIILISVGVGYYTTSILWLPMDIQSGMVMAGYLYIGYLGKQLYRKYDDSQKDWKMLPWCALLLFGVLWAWFYSGMTKTIYLCVNEYPRKALDYFGTLTAVMTVLLLCHLGLEKLPGISGYLSFLGQHTLFLLCLHTLDDRLISWNVVTDRFGQYCLAEVVTLFITKVIFYSVVLLGVTWFKERRKSQSIS